MPCGGGDIGLNVWVENGDILFYISQSGMFDENNQQLKAGRIRLHFPDHPLDDAHFRQELQLQQGNVKISSEHTVVVLWVDVFRPVVHVNINSKENLDVVASFESWRSADHLLTGTEFKANSYKVPQQQPIFTAKDSISFSNNAVLFVHQNKHDKENIFDYTVRMEGLQASKDSLYDPITNNTFGGRLSGDGMRAAGEDSGQYAHTPYHSWVLKSQRPLKNRSLEIDLYTGQTKTIDQWQNRLKAVAEDAAANKKNAFRETTDWWKNFWERSYVFMDGPDSNITRNYQLFRYQLGCNAFASWPTKFNGGLFTFDPVYVDSQYHYSPDFRLWGGGTMTAQNQRLVYFPMLKAGDAALMKPQFDFYLRTLKNAELRTRQYWQHEGASYTEQIENFGLPNITEYNVNRPPGTDPGVEYNPWLEYLWETVFECCFMILDTERYENADIAAYIPLIKSCLLFYDQHYQQLARKRGTALFDEQGKYIFYPTSAAETFKMTYNSTTVISALKVILERMLALPAKYTDSTSRKDWSVMLQRLPAIPLREMNGHTMLAPALTWARVQNTETPQLYPVYPWGIYGIGKPGLDTAINTYWYDTLAVKFRSAVGWQQHNIFAARLGLVDEAVRLTREKFADGPHRFPTFWGPGYDWTPDHNRGGTAMIGLQEMLMQVDGKKIFLTPAWPAAWNVLFRLHAPYKTIIEGEIRAGKIIQLQVTPASREADIIIR